MVDSSKLYKLLVLLWVNQSYWWWCCVRNQGVYPVVVAAHPQDPNQFAVGLTDGSVKVVEPSESEGKWGVSPSVDNGMINGRTASSSTTSNQGLDAVQR